MERWRILVVDDDEDTCDLVRMTLEEDYDVLSLSNPLEVPQVLETFEPDLIILDVMMPKISGFQMADYLKKNAAYKNIPVVFLSAKGAIKDQKYGYSLGASLYLTKPFEPSRLVKNIRLMLNGSPLPPRVKQQSTHAVREKLAHLSSCKFSVATLAGHPEQTEANDPAQTQHQNWLD